MLFPPAKSVWMDRLAAVSRYRVNKIGNIWAHCAISAQQNTNFCQSPRFDRIELLELLGFLPRTGLHPRIKCGAGVRLKALWQKQKGRHEAGLSEIEIQSRISTSQPPGHPS
jgi:hypothetical protein